MQPKETIRFLHPVGKSTLKQGITVPVEVQEATWLTDIPKGCSLPITIQYPIGAIEITLRRINNARGHLQFRYERKCQQALRDYLRETVIEGGLVEICEIGDKVFSLFPATSDISPKLKIQKTLSHSPHEECFQKNSEITELYAAIEQISYSPDFSQRDYNKLIAEHFSSLGWQSEVQLIEDIGLRTDFEKNGVWVEIEFGNARTYYQDLIKLALAWKYRDASLGILLCPTTTLAGLLCELGRRRAAATRPGRSPTYSGMMTFEKAQREFPYLEFICRGNILIGGIDIVLS